MNLEAFNRIFANLTHRPVRYRPVTARPHLILFGAAGNAALALHELMLDVATAYGAHAWAVSRFGPQQGETERGWIERLSNEVRAWVASLDLGDDALEEDAPPVSSQRLRLRSGHRRPVRGARRGAP